MITEYVVNYYGNEDRDGTVQWVPFPVCVPAGSALTLSKSVPTREGYRFVCWNTIADDGGVSYQPGDYIEKIQSDMALQAQWEKLPDKQYTVSFSGNNGCCQTVPGLPENVQVLDGYSLPIPLWIPVREGLVFTGWNTKADGTGLACPPGGLLENIRSDMTLYAQWKSLSSAGCCCF